jgi:membrane-associated phospholipid phosphatase
VALALAVTIVAGLALRSAPALVELNTRLFHTINGLSCGASPADPVYQVMWTGFNQTRTNYIALYAVAAAYVLVRRRDQWPKLLCVGLVVAGLGALSNPVIWHWAWGPRPFAVTDACILYPQYEPVWSSYSSFPSGHARETAAEITLIVTFWRRVWPLGLLYVGLLDFSRLYIGVHFPFDVLAGTLLGIAIGWIAFVTYDVYVAPLVAQWRWRRHRSGLDTAPSTTGVRKGAAA